MLSSALFTCECGRERNVQLPELLEFDFALPWRGGVHTGAPGVLGRVLRGNGRVCRRGWGRFWAVKQQCLMEQLGCRDALAASGVSWLLLEPWNSAAVLCSTLAQMR